MSGAVHGAGTPAPPRGARTATVAVTALAAPFGYAVEALVRALLLPPELEAVREAWSPGLTNAAWVLVALGVVAVPFGLRVKRWHERRAIARLGDRATEAARARAEIEALLVGTSVVQIPSLLAIGLAMFGATATPVLVGIAVATCGIAVQARAKPA